MRSRVREDPRIRFTYGIHPRIVTLERTSTQNIWMEDLDHKLNTTKVVAVGECGLYSTDMKTDINKQLEYFEKQIVLALKKSVPVVIHCRGDTRLDEQCLNSLTRILPRDFKIHIHCFNGNPDTYNKWKAAFPNCKGVGMKRAEIGLKNRQIINETYSFRCLLIL
jgi:TatD DNase family protein